MFAAFIKGITRRLVGNVRAIYIEECTSNDLELLDSLNFRLDFFNQFDYGVGGARRDITRIEQTTRFHREILFNHSFDIVSPFRNHKVKSKSSRAPFLSTFHSILFSFEDKLDFKLILSDYWMEAMALYIPREKLLIIKRAGHIDLKEVVIHDKLVGLRNVLSSVPQQQNQISIVLYHKHLAHHILNELSALQNLVEHNLIDRIRHIYYYDLPIANLERLFPKIPTTKFQKVTSHQLNWATYHPSSFIAPFQKSKLNPEIREKILQGSDDKKQSNREQIRKQHYPVIWVSLRTGNRVWENQAEGLGLLSKSLKNRFENPLLIVDGYSIPYNSETENIYQEILKEQQALKNLKSETEIDCTIMSLIGKPISEVLWWTQVADYYLTHCGTLHHKIGWMADIPGIVHCNEHYTNLPENLTPGFTEHKYNFSPLKLGKEFISDSNSERQNREGKILPQKFANYTIDSNKLVETFMNMIQEIDN